MRKKGADVLIYPPARSHALTCIQMVVYLLNVAVRSELARGKGLHLLSIAVLSELARGTRGRTSLILLLDRGAKINAQGGYYGNALHIEGTRT